MKLWDASPTSSKFMNSSKVRSSMNLNLSSTGTLLELSFDCERYSSIPKELPCGPDPGRYLSAKENKLAALFGKGSPFSDRDDVAELGCVELTFR